MAELINPREYYFANLKDRTKENAEKYFEALANLVHTPIDENIETVNKIRKLQELLKNIKKKLNLLRFAMVMLIILTVALIGVGIGFIINYDINPTRNIIIGILMILAGFGVIVYIVMSLWQKILKLRNEKVPVGIMV